MSVDNPKLRKPKRFQKRKKKQGYEFKFTRVARSSVSASQAAVSRVGDAIIGGDYTGDARGANAIDIQVSRSAANMVASGASAIAYGVNARVAGAQTVGIGANVVAAGDLSVSFGTNAEARGAGQVVMGSDSSAEDVADNAIVVGNTAYGAGAYSAVFGSEASAAGARGVALGYQATSSSDDEAVIAGTVLKLQIAVGTKKVVLTEANWSSYVDLSTKVSKSGDTMTGALMVDGSANTIQLRVQGNATQTANLQTWETSAASVVASIDNSGKITAKDAEIASGATYAYLRLTGVASGGGGGRIDFYEGAASRGYISCTYYGIRIYHPLEIVLDGPVNPNQNIVPYVGSSYTLGSAAKPWGAIHGTELWIYNYYAANVAASIKAASGQTADLLQWKDSSGNVQMRVLANGRDWQLDTTTGTKFGTGTTQKLGFWNATPVARQSAFTQTYSTADKTLSAYTADSESSSYSGIDNAQAGSVYATVADLNALRTAYENLRAFVEDVAAFSNSIVDDFQTIGLLA